MELTITKPVFVTGAPRSGKSVVAKAIGRSRGFAYIEEPIWIWGGLPRVDGSDGVSARAATARVRRYVHSACAAAVKERNANRYVDDYAYHALSLEFLHATFPDLRVIHVVRNPADVIPEIAYGWMRREHSRPMGTGPKPDDVRQPLHVRRRRTITRAFSSPWAARAALVFGARAVMNEIELRIRGRRRTYGPRVQGMAGLGSKASAFEVAAHQWAGIVRAARLAGEGLPEKQWLEVKYEDLIRSPEATFAEIEGVVEPASGDDLSDLGRQAVRPPEEVRNPSRIGARLPTREEWHRLWPIVEEGAAWYGYQAPF